MSRTTLGRASFRSLQVAVHSLGIVVRKNATVGFGIGAGPNPERIFLRGTDNLLRDRSPKRHWKPTGSISPEREMLQPRDPYRTPVRSSLATTPGHLHLFGCATSAGHLSKAGRSASSGRPCCKVGKANQRYPRSDARLALQHGEVVGGRHPNGGSVLAFGVLAASEFPGTEALRHGANQIADEASVLRR
jgi:hypothetical protein